MSDNLQALSVEKLNLSMSRAVSAGFVPHDSTQKHRLTNVLPGEKNNTDYPTHRHRHLYCVVFVFLFN